MSSNWFSGDVVANGINLHYYRTGGDKPPVVLVHGITDNGLCWTRLAQALESDYDLIMVDARGHGLSDSTTDGYTYESHIADLAGLVDVLELDKPVLIGHSMGAANVALAAASYLDLARGVILEDPPWWQEYSAEDRAERADTWRVEIIERKSQTRPEIIAEGREEHPNWAEIEWEPWAEAKQQVNPDVVQWIRIDTPFVHWPDTVRRITCPLLLVTADPKLEAIVTPEVAQEVAAISPLVSVAYIAGAGHSIRREKFAAYVEAVRVFLQDVYPPELR